MVGCGLQLRAFTQEFSALKGIRLSRYISFPEMSVAAEAILPTTHHPFDLRENQEFPDIEKRRQSR